MRLSLRRLRLVEDVDSTDSEIVVVSGFCLAFRGRVFLPLFVSEIVGSSGCEEPGSAPGEASSFGKVDSVSGVGLEVDAERVSR